MVRKINNRLYKVNTYASAHIIEVDDNYDEEVQKLRKEIQFDSLGYKLNLLVYLATLTVQGYAILSVTEFNSDGSKSRVAYASNKDFKKIVKYYFEKKAQETEIAFETRVSYRRLKEINIDKINQIKKEIFTSIKMMDTTIKDIKESEEYKIAQAYNQGLRDAMTIFEREMKR